MLISSPENKENFSRIASMDVKDLVMAFEKSRSSTYMEYGGCIIYLIGIKSFFSLTSIWINILSHPLPCQRVSRVRGLPTLSLFDS